MSEISPQPDAAAVAAASDDPAILRVLMETIPDRIYFKDLESRFVRNNTAHARSLGAKSPADCVGKSDLDYFSREHAERALADEREIIRSGKPIIAKIERLTMRDGSVAWASTTKLPWRDASGKLVGTIGITRDVTAAHGAEERLLDERNLLRTIIDHLPSRIYVKDADSRYVLNNAAHLEMLGVNSQDDATGRTTMDYFPGARGNQALTDDKKVLSGEAIMDQEKSDFGAEGNVHWSLTTKVPLRDRNGVISGLVGISHDITPRKRAELELRLRTEEMEKDVRMARQIQEVFLPHVYPVFPNDASPETTALRFAHRYIPAATLGGDFFDILRLSDTKCGLLVCDVMGHGVRAGLLTALIRGVVEEMGRRAENPVHVVAEINRTLTPILEQTGQPVFATAFYGVIDIAARSISYSNAGHPPPLLRDSGSGDIRRLVPKNPEPAAGLLPNFSYTSHECRFAPGDLFLAYTDGALEGTDSSGRIFGEDRLKAELTRNPVTSGPALCDQLLRALETHTGGSNFEDDVCLVAIEAATAP